MQFAKDTFFVTLRDRLSALNPERTIVLDGQSRPAVVSPENEAVTEVDPSVVGVDFTQPISQRSAIPNAFYLQWGALRAADNFQSSPRPLLALDCKIAFSSGGVAGGAGNDRGRAVNALELELLQICAPPFAEKRDYTQSPATDLGTRIVWTRPRFTMPQSQGALLQASASLTVFFMPEMED
ncbi:MAG TPA: hypothetical protein VFA60_00645 [Terriglobales bacterium]|nr:hypothetical protein [Terriglobales bacterium]